MILSLPLCLVCSLSDVILCFVVYVSQWVAHLLLPLFWGVINIHPTEEKCFSLMW